MIEWVHEHEANLKEAYDKGDRLELEKELAYILHSVTPSGIAEENLPTFELGKLYGMAMVYKDHLSEI